eukprot:CAMPEP_0172646816 /NCGR_PEP_ID=MMETSP1068-20121228/240431_1 /TAXON_ID=35684 /ORGANISM="Pseudopedinella elastica, Strain CCMP716" /LENGTH=453 /DNA_ID=CAMNT_0013461081 /DNA_START=168 /DNA_END=1530 /DNA_ORIENTATION=+
MQRNGSDEALWDGYALDEPMVDISETTPRILLMGSRRSGKSSMAGVVFQKMPPHETLFMDSTSALSIKYVANNPFVQFQIWDFPGDFDFAREELIYGGQAVSPQLVFGPCAALVFVVDAQDEPYQDSLVRLVKTVQLAYQVNPKIAFEVFVHKVDGDLFLTDEQKIDCQHEVQQTVLEDLAEMGLDMVHLTFYLTSIYDHTIFEAFSKVSQKLMPEQHYSTLENLLNDLISNSNMEKSFLFDVVSKIYIATDSNPVDMQSYELCSDMIDVVVDVSCIYGLHRPKPSQPPGGVDKAAKLPAPKLQAESDAPTPPAPAAAAAAAAPAPGGGEGHSGSAAGGVAASAASAAGGAGFGEDLVGSPTASPLGAVALPGGVPGGGWAFDDASSSVIRLSNGMVLYLREVNDYLALVCLLRAENLSKRGLIDYNIDCFKRALSQVFALAEPQPSSSHQGN